MQLDLDFSPFLHPEIPLPEIWTVEQRYQTPTLTTRQVADQTRQALAAILAPVSLSPGAEVAIGVGSRGLDNLQHVVQTVVAALKERGLRPFLVPAMGSHGGATAEGQESVLRDYGISPETVGAEVRPTMEVVEVGRLEGDAAGPFAGHVVCCDRNAFQADAILVINRVKPHTDFHGSIESGLAKMCAIGLGKQKGAAGIHRHGAFGLQQLIPRVARYLAERTPLLGGIALLENEFSRTAEIHPLRAEQLAGPAEQALLERARQITPRLPFAVLDVLLIDEIGKNISGAGMDTHVIGRALMPSIREAEWGGPDIRLIAALDITQPSHGNASGLGLADLTTRKLIEKVDFFATFTNTSTSGEGGILKSRIPVILPTGDDCVRTAIATCGHGDPAQVRLARIRNTADLQFLEISRALLEAARGDPQLQVAESSRPLDLCRPVRPEAA